MVCIMESFSLESNSVFIWKYGRPVWLAIGMYLYFGLAFGYGAYINKGKMRPLLKLMRHPGRAVADFVLMDGAGTNPF